MIASRGFVFIFFDLSNARCCDHAVVRPDVSSLFRWTRYILYILTSLSRPRNLWQIHRPMGSIVVEINRVFSEEVNPLNTPPG